MDNQVHFIDEVNFLSSLQQLNEQIIEGMNIYYRFPETVVDEADEIYSVYQKSNEIRKMLARYKAVLAAKKMN